MTVKKLCTEGLFICFAAALSALETLLPPLVPIPGIRMGLGNIVTLFVLYIGGAWRAYDAYIIAVLRCFLAALITGSMMSAAYGLAGGVLACTAMMIMRRVFPKKPDSDIKFDTQYLPFAAVAGAVFHIAGQMLAAVAFYGSKYVLAYVPVLLASAVAGGVFTGFLTMLLLKKMPRKILSAIRFT